MLPNTVKQENDGYYSVNYIALIPVLTQAIKEQHQEEKEQAAQEAADGKVKEKAEKAKPVRAGAVPFAEQIRAAKVTRDPLLAKILGTDQHAAPKPGVRTIL